MADFVCPCCGGKAVYDGCEANERQKQHGNFFFYYLSFVHYRQPNIKCPKCGSAQIEAPFESEKK